MRVNTEESVLVGGSVLALKSIYPGYIGKTSIRGHHHKCLSPMNIYSIHNSIQVFQVPCGVGRTYCECPSSASVCEFNLTVNYLQMFARMMAALILLMDTFTTLMTVGRLGKFILCRRE